VREPWRAGYHRTGLAAAEGASEITTGGVLQPAAENLTEHGDPERVTELPECVHRASGHTGPRPGHRRHRRRGQRRDRQSGADTDEGKPGHHDDPGRARSDLRRELCTLSCR
jgi:hypothetical protein